MLNTWTIVAVFIVSLLALLVVNQWCYESIPRNDVTAMENATRLTNNWFTIVAEEKHKRGINNTSEGNSPFTSLVGDEYSEITTTLGSLEAKTTAANPEFAALIVRMLHDAGIDSQSTVGVTVSGSFPSLSIATLAALQTIGAQVVVMSSLGASSYGANQVQATWIDIEQWLREQGGLRYRSFLVSYGGEGDSGGGIPDEGKLALMRAAQRNGRQLFIPATYEQAIDTRLQVLKEARIALLINIGGNQVSMGYCAHSTTIPNGYHRSITSCMEPGRGLLVRMSESGIPFIQLLNIRDLAMKNNMPLIPDGRSMTSLYSVRTVKKLPVALMTLSIVAALLLLCRTKE